jgi:poly(hydroxyalkanoate) granule-associated protein
VVLIYIDLKKIIILISEEFAMFETLDKIMLAGLGAVTMTQEKAEELFDNYVDKGRDVKKSRSGFVKEIMDSAEKTRKELEKIVSEQVGKTVNSMQLATKEDVLRLEAKLDKLLAAEGK